MSSKDVQLYHIELPKSWSLKLKKIAADKSLAYDKNISVAELIRMTLKDTLRLEDKELWQKKSEKV